MLISNGGHGDVFFDSVDSLSPPQECVLTKQELGYEVWVNEPLSVKERRERFLQGMGLVEDSSKVCLQEKTASFDESSASLGMERVRDCIGAVSNACIMLDDKVPEKLVPSIGESSYEDKADTCFQGKLYEPSSSGQEHRDREAEAVEEFREFEICKKNKKRWWERFVNSGKGGEGKDRSKVNRRRNKSNRIHVKQNKKKWMELSALYIGQEIRAHKGLVWTMKFSPNGKYLASGGEDGVVRIWRLVSLDTSSVCFGADDSIIWEVKHGISCSQRKNSSQSLNVLPKNILQIEESPMQEFYGHSGDVLDLAWSNSDILLSSSTDKTVRLWQIGCNECLSVFHHRDYVTCIQFNPVDENYFISGSIDGKVRIWGVHEERVVDWANIRDVVSAISYQPDGKGFVVGTLTGTCRFFIASGKHFQLEAQIRVNGKKRTSGNKITGIQFSPKNHQRIMITSEDSKVRILEGIELVQTYKGLPKSGSQMSGSFTSTGKHLISVGDDSRIYIWNSNELGNASSKHTKPQYSCESFISEGVTVAIPWSGMTASSRHNSSEVQPKIEAVPGVRDSERFSFRSWFSLDGTCRGTMTWPEEKLLSCDLSFAEEEFDYEPLCVKDPCHNNYVSETWGLSIVAAGCDGTIKTFHNFGLPVRL
ncbi:PREDICTED: WD repeat-containing protein 44-like isoform X2 [Lupinus angustifolius]|uniref:WD repeat-containing protein 44-like isoform X2 n=1 Tax=Lupinus angustifolius TaxID=3871 RepID=UPI00092E9C19|nr:PREDICTED: WD repeat-containing protein 44-like isoform X2 [Lupinus angustifolius]